ncbi:MAG: hypothetical protein ACRDZS_09900, partial [Acidimicrobiales bacterium]
RHHSHPPQLDPTEAGPIPGLTWRSPPVRALGPGGTAVVASAAVIAVPGSVGLVGPGEPLNHDDRPVPIAKRQRFGRGFGGGEADAQPRCLDGGTRDGRFEVLDGGVVVEAVGRLFESGTSLGHEGRELCG